MIGLILLGGAAIASTAALAYDYFTDKDDQPQVVINTERTYASVSDWKDKLVVGGMIIAGVFVYLKYIKRR